MVNFEWSGKSRTISWKFAISIDSFSESFPFEILLANSTEWMKSLLTTIHLMIWTIFISIDGMHHNCNAQIDSVQLSLNWFWNIVINSKFKQSCLNKQIINIETAIDMNINCSEIISKCCGKKPDGKVQLTAN